MPLPTVSDIDWSQFVISLGDTTTFITKFEAYLAARNLTNGEQNVLLQAMVDWTNTPEDTLIPAVSGGNQEDDYSFVHWLAKTVAEKVAAEAAKAAAEAWAIMPEDTPVPVSAGGDGVTTFSSLHHRMKAAIENGINDSVTGLLTTYSSTKIEAELLATRGATDSQLANIAVNAFNIAVTGGLAVKGMVDGVSDVFTNETGIDVGSSINQAYDATGDFYDGVVPSELAYPPAHSATYVKTSSELNTNYQAYFATDPALSLTGDSANKSWQSNAQSTNQRFHIDYGSSMALDSFNYNNYADNGSGTSAGVKNFTLWGSNNAAAFAELTYGTDTNWTQLTTSSSQFLQHVSSDVEDTQSFTITTPGSYRYYAFKFEDNWGAANMGFTHLEGSLNAYTQNIIIHTEPVTALASPDEAFVVVHQEDVDAVTLNTDLTAWVTRTALSTYTTLAATDNKIRVTAHGHSDDDRVIVSTASGTGFATGLSGLIAYYVINADTNDFELSLTSGGAAVLITADSGTTQHVTDYSQAILTESASLDVGRILTGDADLTSQAAGTEIRTVLLTKNIKKMKFHAISTQWA